MPLRPFGASQTPRAKTKTVPFAEPVRTHPSREMATVRFLGLDLGATRKTRVYTALIPPVTRGNKGGGDFCLLLSEFMKNLLIHRLLIYLSHEWMDACIRPIQLSVNGLIRLDLFLAFLQLTCEFIEEGGVNGGLWTP